MNNINTYLEELYIKDELLYEFDLNSIKKLIPEDKIKELIKGFKADLNSKDPIKSLKKIKSKLNFIPHINTSSFDKFMISKIPNFNSLKKYSREVLENSLTNINQKSLDAASSFLAYTSVIMPKNESNKKQKDNLKINIKKFVFKFREFDEEITEENEKTKKVPKEYMADLIVAWTVVAMAVTLSIGLIVGIFVFGGGISIPTIMPYIWQIVAIIFGITIAAPIMEGAT